MVVAGTVIATVVWGVASTAVKRERCMSSEGFSDMLDTHFLIYLTM